MIFAPMSDIKKTCVYSLHYVRRDKDACWFPLTTISMVFFCVFHRVTYTDVFSKNQRQSDISLGVYEGGGVTFTQPLLYQTKFSLNRWALYL